MVPSDPSLIGTVFNTCSGVLYFDAESYELGLLDIGHYDRTGDRVRALTQQACGVDLFRLKNEGDERDCTSDGVGYVPQTGGLLVFNASERWNRDGQSRSCVIVTYLSGLIKCGLSQFDRDGVGAPLGNRRCRRYPR